MMSLNLAAAAAEIGIREEQAEAVLALLDAGNTVPFIARYRKDMTGNLDDQTLRVLERKIHSLKQLESRREEILHLLEEQGIKNQKLFAQIKEADSLTRLDDLYRPYRPKRVTRASKARKAGLLPAALLLKDPQASYRAFIQAVDKSPDSEDFAGREAKIRGAEDILAESLSDSPAVRSRMRRRLREEAVLTSEAKTKGESVYANYADFSQDFKTLKGYQVLAINRGEREGKLRVKLNDQSGSLARELEGFFHRMPDKQPLIAELCEDSWKRLLKPSLENELRSEKTEAAHEEAMRIFEDNLRSALLAPPLRGKTVLALDPGFRNGCKLAVCSPQGDVLAVDTIYPLPPQNNIEDAAGTVERLILDYGVDCLALGNGTATRETESFLTDSGKKKTQELPLLIVNEAGASVYSASAAAAEEFPDMDVSHRSAVSLARRLQDPLAELVKIDPAALGLGQYQHDMKQTELRDRLDKVTEDCVNKVGCDLNTASAALLSRIAGIGKSLAENIVAYREENGPFHSREELKKVPRLGPKAFEQCAGFLRIPGGENFLDNTSVHPESYEAAEKILALLQSSDPAKAASRAKRLSGKEKEQLARAAGCGRHTLDDILDALAKPGRDPRKLREMPERSKSVRSMEDLKSGMILPGVVRNVTSFGAFVDIGVHQDGLVHISEIADAFVKDPSDYLHSGQQVRVMVLDVDIPAKRISLSTKASRLNKK